MLNFGAIYKRELTAYFLGLTAYVLLAFYLLISSFFFYAYVTTARAAEMRPILSNMAIIFLFLAPVLTTRLWSEELRQGTDELLYTSPVASYHVVLAKFSAALTVFAVFLLCTGIYPVVLNIYGTPDWKALFSGYAGLLLFGASCLAVGFFASSLTESQVVAGVIGFSFLLLLWIVSWMADALSGTFRKVVEYLSITAHFGDFAKGVIDTSHAIYFVSLIIGFLFLTTQRIESARYR